MLASSAECSASHVFRVICVDVKRVSREALLWAWASAAICASTATQRSHAHAPLWTRKARPMQCRTVGRRHTKVAMPQKKWLGYLVLSMRLGQDRYTGAETRSEAGKV